MWASIPLLSQFDVQCSCFWPKCLYLILNFCHRSLNLSTKFKNHTVTSQSKLHKQAYTYFCEGPELCSLTPDLCECITWSRGWFLEYWRKCGWQPTFLKRKTTFLKSRFPPMFLNNGWKGVFSPPMKQLRMSIRIWSRQSMGSRPLWKGSSAAISE